MKKKIDLSGPSLFPWVICTKCGVPYPDDPTNFPYVKGKRNGRVCKICAAKRTKKWSFENREILAIKRKEYRIKNADPIHIYQRKYNQEHKVELNKWRENNSDKCKVVADRSREKTRGNRLISVRKYGHSRCTFKTFVSQLTIEEDPIEGEDGFLLAKCAYCGQYFYPTIIQARGRIASLTNKGHGENRLYCSSGCKTACPIFQQKSWPRGYKPASSREVDPLIRQMCLARDNYECQKCGVSIEDAELHAHHIEGGNTDAPIS